MSIDQVSSPVASAPLNSDDGGASFSKAKIVGHDLKWPDEPQYFQKRHLEELFAWATEQGASDITIQSNESIVLEIYGKKIRITNRKLTIPEVQDLVEGLYKDPSIKAKLSGSDDSDFSYQVKPNRFEVYRYRVNAVPIQVDGQRGIEITARTIPTIPEPLSALNIEPELIDALFPKMGMVVITGGTGSGKTTLLSSVIRDMLEQPDGNRKILTYEAPIEFVYDKVNKPTSIIAQTEVPTGLPSFARGTRNALRRKPDVILVGEARDAETIGEAITASMTGHALYTTVHSNGFADTIRRMVNVFPDGEKNSRATDIVSNLKLVISQQLVPATNKKRIALREYVIFNSEIVDIILNAGVENLTRSCRRVLKEFGRSFAQDAREKFQQGLISAKTLKKIEIDEVSAQRDYDVIENKAQEKTLKIKKALPEDLSKDAVPSVEDSEKETASDNQGTFSFGNLNQKDVLSDVTKY